MESSKFNIYYKKAKKNNLDILESVCEIQHYNPIYSRFFEMDETNYNRITLNHKYHIYDLNTVYDGEELISKEIFVKYSPLLDPLNFLRGKYDLENSIFKTLPKLGSTEETCMSKVLDVNNSSYVDGFFCYLTSMLREKHNWIHGVEYYGSVLGVQKGFKYDIIDDIDFLSKTPFFINNLNKYFTVDEDTSIILREYSGEGSRTNKKKLSIKEAVSDIDIEVLDLEEVDSTNCVETNMELEYLCEDVVSCDSESESDSESDTTEECDEESDEESVWETDEEAEGDVDGEEESESSSLYSEDEKMWSYLKEFPVQMIFQEKCQGTLDELIMQKKLKDNEMIEALLQVVLILATYQNVFDFTHNDLHTNNIMYVETEEPFLYYFVGDVHYKVPSNGRIFKIIDFGRAIYKFGGKLFCSNSFAPSGDAATQYNCEPYFNENKPRIDPNPSFDLCRLGCSLYDFICRDGETKTPLQKLVDQWCTDDFGKNVIYKPNGQERYPDFKLYKMIARTVNNLVPVEQLKLPIFSKYAYSERTISERTISERTISERTISEIPKYI